jgi:hypothetical protein
LFHFGVEFTSELLSGFLLDVIAVARSHLFGKRIDGLIEQRSRLVSPNAFGLIP